MKNTIRVNGQLYEAVTDINSFYLPDKQDILGDLKEIENDLKEIFSKDIPRTVKSRELSKKFSNAFIAIDDLREYIQKNYESTEHYV